MNFLLKLYFICFLITKVTCFDSIVQNFMKSQNVGNTKQNQQYFCQKEEIILSNSEILIWPQHILLGNEDAKFVISYPPCFDENNNIVTRRCTRLGWDQAPKCSLSKNELEIEDYIVRISDRKLEWNENFCHGSDRILPDLDSDEREFLFKKLFFKMNITQFWLPARRLSNEIEYSPAAWKLPGKYWNTELRIKYNYESAINKCILMKISSNFTFRLQETSLDMTNCNEKHYQLCVYKRDYFKYNWCPKLFYSFQDKPTHCYGITNNFKEIVNNKNKIIAWNIYLRDKNFLKYILDKLKIRKLYLMDFYNDGAIIFYKDGYLRIESKYQMNYYLKDIIVENYFSTDVKMHLDFQPNDETLLLTIYNRNSLYSQNNDGYGVKCFTNSDSQLIRNVKIKDLLWEDNIKSIFEVKLYGMGEYWCEAHRIQDYKIIQSTKVLAWEKRKGFVFAMFVELPCVPRIINCYDVNANIKKYAKYVEHILDDLRKTKNMKFIEIEDVIIMNIESITDKLKAICHVTVSMKDHNFHEESSEEDDEDDEFNEDDGDETKHNSIWHMASVLERLRNLVYGSNYFYGTVNNTEYCLPSLKRENEDSNWRPTRIGMTTTKRELCLLSNGLPAPRKCIGNFLYGAQWEVQSSQLTCIQKISNEFITNKLFDIERTKIAKRQPSKILHDVDTLISSVLQTKIIPADIFYLSKILQSIKKTVQIYQNEILFSNETLINVTSTSLLNIVEEIELNVIMSIFNQLLKVDENVLQISAKLNSTNFLLEAFENLVDVVSVIKFDTVTSLPTSIVNYDGVIASISDSLMIFTIDMSKSDFTGILIFDSTACKETFVKCEYVLLSKYDTPEEILNQDRIELGSYVPESLLNRLGEIEIMTNKSVEQIRPTIVIKIFRNDRLFIENEDITDIKAFSKVMSISLPGYDHNLPELLPIFLKTERMFDNSSICGYWNYSTWDDVGIKLLAISNYSDNVVLCGTTHLTPFALLLGGFYNNTVDDDVVIVRQIHYNALDIITLLGCSLSLIGIVGIFATAIIFQSWREKASTKILLQFSLAIGLQMIVFCFVNTEVLTVYFLENDNFTSCILLGSCMHYIVLVQFSWMLIIAYLQYKRYVQVLGNKRPTRFFVKSFILGWTIPFVPVVLVIVFDRTAYIPDENDSVGVQICYPSGLALYYGVMLPIAVIIISNLIIFIAIIWNIMKGTEIRHTSEKKLALSQLRLLILLFFLLGLTWIFGFLAAVKAGILFSYLFCITATLQGFVLFVYFVILDPLTRGLWRSFLKRDDSNNNNIDSRRKQKKVPMK